ncbi:MAG: hypothetical protein HUK16_05695 [Bacteroidales bacterium]|nr:hypothetical protein [Bacteroidales bacterium]
MAFLIVSAVKTPFSCFELFYACQFLPLFALLGISKMQLGHDNRFAGRDDMTSCSNRL